MGTKKAAKKTASTKKRSTTSPNHKDTGVTGNVDKAFRDGKGVDLRELVEDRERMSAERNARRAANDDVGHELDRRVQRTEDMLPDNTPVWLNWPPGPPKRALLVRYAPPCNPICRVGSVDAKGAYTGRLGSERTFERDDVLGPIWLIDMPSSITVAVKGPPDDSVATAKKVVNEMIERDGRPVSDHDRGQLEDFAQRLIENPSTPKTLDVRRAKTDAELLAEMGAPFAPPASATPKTEAATPKTSRKRRGGALDPSDGICPTHNVPLSGNEVQRGCLFNGCEYTEKLVDGKWSQVKRETLRRPGDWNCNCGGSDGNLDRHMQGDEGCRMKDYDRNFGRCPHHPNFEMRVTPSGKYRDCIVSGCRYQEMIVNGIWSQVPAEPKKADNKPTTKREEVLASAAQPVSEIDPKCPTHGKLLIQTRQGNQKLCPVDACDYYIAKHGDTWRVMHEAPQPPAGTTPAPEPEFLPPFEDDFDSSPPWEA